MTTKKKKNGFAMGLCGKNLAWMLDDGVLTIVGEGEMECGDGYPWRSVSTLVTSVVIEDGATSIGNFAFDRCPNLTSAVIPDSVTSIGNGAFSGCTGLTSVIIPNSVTSIGVFAFGGCTGLTDITIPNSVRVIRYGAFSDCIGLTDVYYTGSKGDWNAVLIFGDGEHEWRVNATFHFGR